MNAGAGTITINGGAAAIQLNASTLSTTNASATAVTIQNATTVALGTISATGTVVLGAGDITGALTQNLNTGITAGR